MRPLRRAADQARVASQLEEREKRVSLVEHNAQNAARELEEQAARLAAEASDLQALRKTLGAETEALEERHRENERQAHELTVKFKDLDEQRVRTEAQRLELNNERTKLGEIETSIGVREAEHREREVRLEQRQAEIQSATAKLESDRLDLRHIQAAMEEDRRLLESDRQDVTAAQAALDQERAANEAKTQELAEREHKLAEHAEQINVAQSDLATREIEIAVLQEGVDADRKQLAELSSQIQERETFFKAARKQFQSTLEEFRADQRRFRLATSSVKAHRERSRRRKESPAATKDDQEWAQVLSTEGVLSVPQAQWFEDGRFGNFVVGGYRIAELLSLGTTDWVYEAGDLTDSRRVAIKVLCQERSTDPAAIRRLEREARLGGAVDHKNLVKTSCFIKSDQGMAYFVMDLVEGVTLAELLAVHGKLPWREVCNYIFQASIGLHRLHEAGIVHRDVQPSNLLIERNGGLRLGDFGSATAQFLEEDAAAPADVASLPQGAIDYAAPEVFDHDRSTGVQADLYSLGCTFYYALTGTVPFPDYEDAEKIRAHCSLPPQPIRQSASGVPANVIGLIRQLMAKDPKNRPASMQDVTGALSALARPQPVYFDRHVIFLQRTAAARAKLRERARQLAERVKSVEASTAPSS